MNKFKIANLNKLHIKNNLKIGNMKKIDELRNLKFVFILLTIFFIVLSAYSPYIYATSTDIEVITDTEEISELIYPEIISEAAILIDSTTNRVLYEKNSEEKMYPASTTKILTAILTIENCDLDEVVTASTEAVNSIPDGYSSAYINIGEQLTVYELLEVLLVHSANDAANILAEHVGGSIESFVAMMNTKLTELGLTNTNFTNSFGMYDENHYTTAHDMALLMDYCLQDETFRKITGLASCTIDASNMSDTRIYSNTNKLLLSNNTYYYDYATTGKTGYTTESGYCLISSSYHNDIELICVILGGDSSLNNPYIRFEESAEIYDFGYDNYSISEILTKDFVAQTIEVSNTTEGTVSLNLLVEDTISGISSDIDLTNAEFIITLNEDISAPIAQYEVLGTISCTIDEITYTSNLIAENSLEPSRIFAYIVVAILIIFIFFLIFVLSKNNDYKNVKSINKRGSKNKGKRMATKNIKSRGKTKNIYKNKYKN